jgi:hypothetical protein
MQSLSNRSPSQICLLAGIKEQGIAGVAVAKAIFASDSQLFQWLAGRIPCAMKQGISLA